MICTKKKPRYNTLVGQFIVVNFLIIMLTSFTLLVVTMAAIHFGFIDSLIPSPLFPLITLVLISVFISLAASSIISTRMLKPMTEISHALREVSSGDFSVRLNENRNVKELSEICENFNKMSQELSGIEMLRSDFIVSVSHEFKTPLAAIEGYAQLLRQVDRDDKEFNDYIELIIGSTKSLTVLCGNILKLSKLENQEIISTQEVFSLDEQIRQIILMLEPKWSEKKLEMDIEMEEIKYFGSKELIAQIWVNLIENAIKFTPKRGQVTVRLFADQQEVIARIIDTGIGVSAKDHQRIFEKFYQSDQSKSTQGNGLGLALVKRILDICKGKITLESTAGEGCTFTVYLPINNII